MRRREGPNRSRSLKLVERPSMLRLPPHDERQLAREREGDAHDMFGHRARPNAARARQDDRTGDEFRGEDVPDPRRRRLHPFSRASRRHDIAVDERREGGVGFGQRRGGTRRGPRRRGNVCCGNSRRSWSTNGAAAPTLLGAHDPDDDVHGRI